jgi:hypothetical protein
MASFCVVQNLIKHSEHNSVYFRGTATAARLGLRTCHVMDFRGFFPNEIFGLCVLLVVACNKESVNHKSWRVQTQSQCFITQTATKLSAVKLQFT